MALPASQRVSQIRLGWAILFNTAGPRSDCGFKLPNTGVACSLFLKQPHIEIHFLSFFLHTPCLNTIPILSLKR